MQDTKAFPQSRKRPLEDATAQIQDSPCYKVRAAFRDLRPHFIEVLKTPDFRNCKAANNIREGMKLLLDLYKEMVEQSSEVEKCSNGDVDYKPKPVEHQQDQDVKPAEKPPQNEASANPLDNHVQGTYIVGGSAFGWNFITFSSSKAVYYGRTKEAFQAMNAKAAE